MRIVNFALAVMFLVFAFLQVNDPDPVVWLLIYGSMAVVSVLAIFEFFPRKVLLGMLAAYAGYASFFWKGLNTWMHSDNKSELFDDLTRMEKPYIEESREFLGLFICILVLAFYLLRSFKRPTVYGSQ